MKINRLNLRNSLNKAFLKVKPNPNPQIKGRTDLVIHIGKDTKSPVGVLLETKKPGNRSEMPSIGNIRSETFLIFNIT